VKSFNVEKDLVIFPKELTSILIQERIIFNIFQKEKIVLFWEAFKNQILSQYYNNQK